MVVERYLTPNTWHYISAPVDDPTASVFLGMYMMEWDEPSGQWAYIVDPSFVMSTDMEGYAIWTNSTETVEFTGDLNTGPKSIATTNTFGAPHDNKGFNFVGNPYPSSLDWNVDDNSGWSRTAGNIDLSLYIWNGAAGNYGVYVKDAANGTNDVNNLIPPHQGFFVHCSAATGTLGVDDGARVHGNKDILKSGNDEQSLNLKVTGNGYADEAMFRIDDQATVNYDNCFDGMKYRGLEEAPQLYSISADENELSVNSFPVNSEYSDIPVGFEAGDIYLEDLKIGEMIQLSDNSHYGFTANTGDNPARFVLHMNVLGIDTDRSAVDVLIFSKDNEVCVSTNRSK